MYTGDTSSTVSQGNTKSTIQALLKNRERFVAVKPSSSDSVKDKSVLPNYSVISDFSDLGAIPKNLEFDTRSQSSPEHIPSNSNLPDNLEYQKDFNYSQKLFHIADGNLYSIFSPIQGRSYGMKPSFLRKQKYTVQECHSRGRKNLRKGLKFHNFLPSESVTSEKDNRYLNTKWKVHSECRLREEHGTKQITISNWSQSIQNPPEDSANYVAKNNLSAASSATETNAAEPASSPKQDSSGADNFQPVSDPYDFNLCLQQQTSESNDLLFKLSKVRTETAPSSPPVSYSSKKDSLNFVLNSLMEKPSLIERKNSYTDEIDAQNKSFQKHRRKPVQTRRVVPYVKYLSIMEENDSLPLDLSSKCLIDNSSSPSVSTCDESQNISGKNVMDFINPNIICDKNTNSNYAVSSNESLQISNTPNDKVIVNTSSDGMLQTQIAKPVTVLYPLPFNKNSNMGKNGFHPTSLQGPSNSKMEVDLTHDVNNSLSISIDNPYSFVNQPLSNNSVFSVQKSFVKEIQSKPRKRNQRSVIKQKLEDTFRQNGFLVKTKQVSDGEATFCKFRQLRKYTRYYLKSLEQHLPDEFHKMWKGFLPPKTVLPPVLGTPESANESL